MNKGSDNIELFVEGHSINSVIFAAVSWTILTAFVRLQ